MCNDAVELRAADPLNNSQRVRRSTVLQERDCAQCPHRAAGCFDPQSGSEDGKQCTFSYERYHAQHGHGVRVLYTTRVRQKVVHLLP